MKLAAAVAIGITVAGCVAPPAPPSYRAAAPPPILLDTGTLQECASIAREIAVQQRNAAFGSVMATPLVQASVQINAYTVINALQTRAAIVGCPQPA